MTADLFMTINHEKKREREREREEDSFFVFRLLRT